MALPITLSDHSAEKGNCAARWTLSHLAAGWMSTWNTSAMRFWIAVARACAANRRSGHRDRTAGLGANPAHGVLHGGIFTRMARSAQQSSVHTRDMVDSIGASILESGSRSRSGSGVGSGSQQSTESFC